MKKLLLLIGLLGLFGCERYKPGEDAKEHTPSIVYIKDERTHLCFASYGLGYNYGVLANVPCSDEVEQQIVFQYKREHRDD
jgi:hypothetical protein